MSAQDRAEQGRSAVRRPTGLRSVLLLAVLASQSALAGPFGDEMPGQRVAQAAPDELEQHVHSNAPAALPRGTRVMRDVPYGSDRRQRFDVYVPRQANGAPIIFMVHGGAWRFGSKAERAVIENKMPRWVSAGFAFVSTDYRMLPTIDPLEQAKDVARAIARVQALADSWGADPGKLILMGHSAGAHLVTLLATDRSLSAGIISRPWLGTIALDSAAYDVVEIMEGPHLRLYDRAFGRDPGYWRAASPYHALTAAIQPLLAVCSTRSDDACPQARKFAQKAKALGSEVTVLEMNFSHREINLLLGGDPSYTAAVESFMATLDPVIAERLATGKGQAHPDASVVTSRAGTSPEWTFAS